MSKVLIVCCDGTWNTPDQRGRPTNVTKMTRALLPRAPDGTPQLVYYDEGVGTGNRFDRFLGGTLGVGLGTNVRQAYRFLALNYEPGDRIAMFGFSRGAFTVRSLAGLVNLAGLLRKGDLDKMRQVWDCYREKPENRREDQIDTRWLAERRPGVDFLGVWDTVGSLGIPGDLLGPIGRRRHEFHDVTLGKHVRRAFQALAIDEHRRNFLPAVWDTTGISDDQEVEQAWFAGAHSNVGGGYPDSTLSDQAFMWMIEKASPLLAFDEDYLERKVQKLNREESRALLVDSRRGVWKLLGKARRTIGADPSEVVHPSALARLEEGQMEVKGSQTGWSYEPFPYNPANLLAYLEELKG